MSVFETLAYSDAALADTRGPSQKQINTLRSMLTERSIEGAMQPKTMTAGREMYDWLLKIDRTDGKTRTAKVAAVAQTVAPARMSAEEIQELAEALAPLVAALIKPARRAPKSA